MWQSGTATLALRELRNGGNMKENRKLSDALWTDLETDEERVNFLISGRGFETGIIAKAVQNEVAMAFQFRAEIIKERMKDKAAPED